MSDFVIDTSSGQVKLQNEDPWDHLPAKEWVDKQVEYGKDHISGEGLIPIINTLKGDLVGCEIGVCLGFTAELFALQIPNLKTLYAVDHYPAFVDWNGVRVNEERQFYMKEFAFQKLKNLGKVKRYYMDSKAFSETIDDESLDFIFIDGDHSYKGALADFQNFFPKIKPGGIFAGHDINIQTVNSALQHFLGERISQLNVVSRDAWYLIK